MSTSRKEQVLPHSHCQNCGKSVPVNKTFCSKKCDEQIYTHQKKSQRNSQMYMIAFIVLIIMLLLWSFF
ncbi:DUF2116 family Zn-ribbon domain-containing protein [Thermoproteota archaeon]